MKEKFKKYFITGLIAILPLWLSLYILWIIFGWIGNVSKPFVMLATVILGIGYTETIGKIFGFFLTLITVCLVGYIASKVVGRKLFLIFEDLFIKIPLLKDLYLSIKQLTKYIFVERPRYKSVVLVEFPRQGLYSLGFVTNDEININGKKKACVFIPTTPNPTSGYLEVVDISQVQPLDITVEEGMKLIVSGGIILPEKLKK